MIPGLEPVDGEEKDLLPRPTLVMSARTNLESMDDFFAGMLPVVQAFLDEREQTPTGPPFVRYLDMASDLMQIEGGLPIGAPTPGTGAVYGSELPGGRVVSVFHHGTYDAIGETHDALGVWLREHGLRPAGTPWEVYWVSPLETTTKADWRTEIVVPVTTGTR